MGTHYVCSSIIQSARPITLGTGGLGGRAGTPIIHFKSYFDLIGKNKRDTVFIEIHHIQRVCEQAMWVIQGLRKSRL